MKVFLFHCWGGDGRSCWSGWLADKLRARGIEVIAPDFPNSSEPKLDEWLDRVRSHVTKFDAKDNWVLVGHSLGCPSILHLLERFDKSERVKAVFLVSGSSEDIGIPQLTNFFADGFDWEKIKQKSSKFVVINSDNDPFVPLDEGECLANLVNGEFLVEPGAGHINEGSGFTKYERLLKLILEFG